MRFGVPADTNEAKNHCVNVDVTEPRHRHRLLEKTGRPSCAAIQADRLTVIWRLTSE